MLYVDLGLLSVLLGRGAQSFPPLFVSPPLVLDEKDRGTDDRNDPFVGDEDTIIS